MLSFYDLPPLSKAAVQSIRDMYVGEQVKYYKWKKKYLTANEGGLHWEHILNLTASIGNMLNPTLVNGSIWFKIIKHYELLTPEIMTELMPYILAGNE